MPRKKIKGKGMKGMTIGKGDKFVAAQYGGQISKLQRSK